MKLIILLYLEDDDPCVSRFLKENGVVAYSRLPLEGHGAGMAGWYGDTAPYRSRMAFTIVPEDRAQALMDAVKSCETNADPRHPIHAIQLAVEATADSGGPAARA